jgi:hypothetical protein
MMSGTGATHSLPGLKRLLDICQEHGVTVDSLPPGKATPKAGSLFMGQPFDPLLAAAFERFGMLMLSPWHSLLMRCDDEVNGLAMENEGSRKYWPERFHALTVFGLDRRYCYATVPELASGEGFQPVVRIDPYEDIYALPIASNVDRFFETYSRYLEIVADEPEFQQEQEPSVSFPWEVQELLGADGRLIELLGEGKFDPWMYSGHESTDEQVREWVAKVQAGRR